jgi:translocation and assembly module TamB
LVIKTTTSEVKFNDIYLKDALWSGTKLEFEDSHMDMGYLAVKNATGQMDLVVNIRLMQKLILLFHLLKV